MSLQQLTDAQVSPEVPINENFETLEASAVYGKRHTTTSGLTWGYYGGRFGGVSIADGTLVLTNAADNYVVVALATGVISTSTNTTNWNNTAAYLRVYKITTAGSVVTAVEDHRAGRYGVLGSGSADFDPASPGPIGGTTPGTGRFTSVTVTAGPLDEAAGADIASASTVNLTTATGNIVHITGTTTITGITLGNGMRRNVVFDGALTLTHGASLQLPGNANITTAAGDRAVFVADNDGVVYCVSYTFAASLPVRRTGDTMTGTLQVDSANLHLNSNGALTNRGISFRSNGSQRWFFYVSSTAEGGANAGSNFAFQTYDDSGTFLATPISINRATSLVSIPGGISLTGASSNLINFGSAGLAAPTFTTLSAGTKVALFGGVTGSNAGYNIGMESSAMWLGVGTTANSFRFYGGTTLAATLTGAGVFTPVAAINEAAGANVASAATVNLTTATGNTVHITGTTTITAITLANGARRNVIFDGSLTLTHGANLQLPGGANIQTRAGDRMTIVANNAGVDYVMDYVRADGSPLLSGTDPDDVVQHRDLANMAYVTQTWIDGTKTAYDPASIADGDQASTTVTIPGLVLGDFVMSVALSIDSAGIVVTGSVTATDTVTLIYANTSGGAVDLASHDAYVRCMKRFPE